MYKWQLFAVGPTSVSYSWFIIRAVAVHPSLALCLCLIDCGPIAFLKKKHLILSCGFPTSPGQAALSVTLPQRVLTELHSASWSLMFFLALSPSFLSRTGTQQIVCLCVLAHCLQMSLPLEANVCFWMLCHPLALFLMEWSLWMEPSHFWKCINLKN